MKEKKLERKAKENQALVEGHIEKNELIDDLRDERKNLKHQQELPINELANCVKNLEGYIKLKDQTRKQVKEQGAADSI
jgi:hypothetical protein